MFPSIQFDSIGASDINDNNRYCEGSDGRGGGSNLMDEVEEAEQRIGKRDSFADDRNQFRTCKKQTKELAV